MLPQPFACEKWNEWSSSELHDMSARSSSEAAGSELACLALANCKKVSGVSTNNDCMR